MSNDVMDAAQAEREIREALSHDEWRVTVSFALSTGGTRECLLLEYRDGWKGAWKKHKTGLFPTEGQTIGTVLDLMSRIRAEVRGG